MDEYSSSVCYSDYDDAAVTDKSQSYRPCSLDELVARTKFEKKEIQVIYQGFKQECPSGTVNEKSFKNIFGQFFPFGDTSKYAHLIFSTFELRSSDRLKWVFKLYDTKKTGRLTRDDFHVIVCAVYSLLGNVTNHCNDYMTIQEHTATVFQKFDKLHQGYITIEDFIKLCMQDSMIVQSIDALRVTI
ncbi:unnamed protein product [Rotaria magnacalcarata]